MPVPTSANSTTSDPPDLREANMQLDAVAMRILELSQVNYRFPNSLVFLLFKE